MAKNNFLLVDLNDTKTKKLAETITSETSRKILSYLAEKDDTEANIAQLLGIPISTVHYHLLKLQESGLVKVEEFHYSQKGREVNHYKLANKYIIIAPQKIAGLKEKLRGILPVALVFAGISAVWGVITIFGSKLEMTSKVQEAAPMLEKGLLASASRAYPVDVIYPCYQTFSPFGYFLLGGATILVIWFIIALIRYYIEKRRKI
ncbi:MAG: helix-turn-helix domain-containing protein [Candidatus Woesearchaeota archaeon]|jgi:DNA-binding transcriptional ArsR family regulator